MDLNATKKAFDVLINAAGGQFHIVEIALKQASAAAFPASPSYQDTLDRISTINSAMKSEQVAFDAVA